MFLLFSINLLRWKWMEMNHFSNISNYRKAISVLTDICVSLKLMVLALSWPPVHIFPSQDISCGAEAIRHYMLNQNKWGIISDWMLPWISQQASFAHTIWINTPNRWSFRAKFISWMRETTFWGYLIAFRKIQSTFWWNFLYKLSIHDNFKNLCLPLN